MKELGITLLAIAVLVGLYFAYKFFFPAQEEKGQAENTSNEPNTLNVSDYFVTGDPSNDRQVFMRGLACAKAFLYKNENDLMANRIRAIQVKAGSAGNPCQEAGVNCKVTVKIGSITSADRGELLNYLYNLNSNADNEWKKFSNIASGRKNMCSIILEQGIKERLPNVWNDIIKPGHN